MNKMKAQLEDLNGFLKENKSKNGGFPPIRGRMESMLYYSHKKIPYFPFSLLKLGYLNPVYYSHPAS